jgi:hypothetical protein
MIRKIESKDLTQNAQILLDALKKTGVDLSDEPGTPGKLWRALAAGAREGLTAEFLSEIYTRSEMAVEIEAARARFDATGNQNPADLGFLLLGLFCLSTSDSFEVANDILALLRAKKAGRAIPNDDDERATRIESPASLADRKMSGRQFPRSCSGPRQK